MNPAHEAEYRFLKQQVDRWQDELFRKDPHPNAKQHLDYARDELRDFVRARRSEGVNI